MGEAFEGTARDSRALDGCTILIVSPQPWNHLHISKHHYAIELARRNNTVYFLEPPEYSGKEISISPLPGDSRLFIVSYGLGFPMSLRFHLRGLFDRLMKRRVRQILNQIDRPIDIVWSFEFNLFSDLRIFGSKRVVFHPVDPLSTRQQADVATSADLVISVSQRILDSMKHVAVRRVLVEHGLSRPFAELAAANLGKPLKRHSSVRIGYAGNLTHPALDRGALREMLVANPRAEFHFWGPVTSPVPLAAEYEAESKHFIDFLKHQPNAITHGQVSSTELAARLQDVDCLLIAYRGAGGYDRSNSHKVLEYLSTGRVVVSSWMEAYQTHEDLLRMPVRPDDPTLPLILRETISRLDELNSLAFADRRRRHALDNTYPRQLERIAGFLSDGSRRE